MSTHALAVPELDEDALAVVVEAEALVVNSQERFEYAATLRRLAKDMIAAIEADYVPAKRAADAAKRVLLDQEKAKLELPKRVLALVNEKLAAYETAQRREQAIAQARAAQEAAMLEAARPKVPGQMPLVVPATPVEMPKVANLGFISTFDVVVTDALEFAKAVVAGALPPTALEGNGPVLRDMAKALAKSLPPGTPVVLPGCTVTEKRSPRG